MDQQQQITDNKAVIHYKALRRTIGVLGFFLPVVVGIGALIFFREGLQPSLSEYYYTHMRNVFIGAIWAIGFFLYSYKGFGERENLVGNIAGFCALVVSLAPARPRTPDPTQIEEIAGWIHVASAALFFAFISYYTAAIFTSPEQDDMLSDDERARRNRVYRGCAAVMIVCLILIGLYSVQPEDWRNTYDFTIAPVFWLESLTIMAFGFAWLVKGEAPPFRPRSQQDTKGQSES